MTSATFFRGMAALVTNYRPEPSTERDELYQRALSDLDDAAFMAAVGEIVRRDEFFPTVARIRSAASLAARQAYEHELYAAALAREGRAPQEIGRLLGEAGRR